MPRITFLVKKTSLISLDSILVVFKRNQYYVWSPVSKPHTLLIHPPQQSCNEVLWLCNNVSVKGYSHHLPSSRSLSVKAARGNIQFLSVLEAPVDSSGMSAIPSGVEHLDLASLCICFEKSSERKSQISLLNTSFPLLT